MLFLNLYIILLHLGKFTFAQWLEPKTAEENSSNTLQRRVTIPNPYPMPDSPYSIDFQNVGPFLGPQLEVQTFLSNALDDVVAYILTHGDAPLPILWGDFHVHGFEFIEAPYEFVLRTVVNGLTYNDTTKVLAAYSLKSRFDGPRQRRADVFDPITGDIIGVGTLSRVAFGNASRNTTLQLGPIPNPYVLSDSDLSLDFEQPSSYLVPNDVVNCIVSARQRITRRISEQGETRVTIPSIWFRWRSVEFWVFVEQGPRGVTLTDTLAILDAFAMKSGREGFWIRWANIVLTEGGQMVGQALLGRADPAVGRGVGNRTTSLESYRRARRRILT